MAQGYTTPLATPPVVTRSQKRSSGGAPSRGGGYRNIVTRRRDLHPTSSVSSGQEPMPCFGGCPRRSKYWDRRGRPFPDAYKRLQALDLQRRFVRGLRNVEGAIVELVVAEERISGLPAVGTSHGHTLSPLADEVLELVFDAGAEEVADQTTLDRTVTLLNVRHAATQQGTGARRVWQEIDAIRLLPRIHAADMAAESDSPDQTDRA